MLLFVLREPARRKTAVALPDERPSVRELVRGNGWNVFAVIVVVFLAVIAVSIAAGLIAAGLGSLGRALVQWAVNAALAPVTALSASVPAPADQFNFAIVEVKR